MKKISTQTSTERPVIPGDSKVLVPLVPYMKPVMYKDAASSHVHILICPMFFFYCKLFFLS